MPFQIIARSDCGDTLLKVQCKPMQYPCMQHPYFCQDQKHPGHPVRVYNKDGKPVIVLPPIVEKPVLLRLNPEQVAHHFQAMHAGFAPPGQNFKLPYGQGQNNNVQPAVQGMMPRAPPSNVGVPVQPIHVSPPQVPPPSRNSIKSGVIASAGPRMSNASGAGHVQQYITGYDTRGMNVPSGYVTPANPCVSTGGSDMGGVTRSIGGGGAKSIGGGGGRSIGGGVDNGNMRNSSVNRGSVNRSSVDDNNEAKVILADFHKSRHDIEEIRTLLQTLNIEMAVLKTNSQDLASKLANHEQQLSKEQQQIEVQPQMQTQSQVQPLDVLVESVDIGSRGIPDVNDTEVGHNTHKNEELDDIDKYLSNYVKSYPNLGVQIVKRDVGLYDINDHECNMIICPNDGPSVVSADKNIPLHEFVLLISDALKKEEEEQDIPPPSPRKKSIATKGAVKAKKEGGAVKAKKEGGAVKAKKEGGAKKSAPKKKAAGEKKKKTAKK
eukprot:GHVR01170668.1.p1 GENE.GHVR01170668.1~~GHVR01170668.1.p1  ORF type:complete len:492 (-),score=139.54 GHVR01170668.1:245-1720(-)